MAKVLIDVTDEQYKVLVGQIKKVADDEEFCLSSTEIYNTAYLFLSALESGIVFYGLTNGEAFTSTYPNIEVLGDSESKVGVNLGNGVFINFPHTWWNAKWGE